MLHNKETKERLCFNHGYYDHLIKNDSRSKTMIVKEISNLMIERLGDTLDLDTISRWNLIKNGEPKGRPGKIEYVEIIADVLGVSLEELVYPYEKKILSDIDNTKNDLLEMDWDEIIDEIKGKKILRSHIDYLVWYLFDVDMDCKEKRKMLIKKEEPRNEIKECISFIVSYMRSGCDKEAFCKGRWLDAIKLKRELRNRIIFFHINWILILTYLKDVERFQINPWDIINIFWGGKMLTEEMILAVDNIIRLIEEKKIRSEIPVKDENNADYFRPLDRERIDDTIKYSQVLLFPGSYRSRKKVRDRFEVVDKYAKNHGIYLRIMNMNFFYPCNLEEIRIVLMNSKTTEAIMMYDDEYGGDFRVKRRVEAYVVENGLNIIYCKQGEEWKA